MKKIKTFVALLLCLVAVTAVFTGCRSGADADFENAGGSAPGDNKYDIVVTDERLIVYEVNASITVDDVDQAVKKVRADLSAADGYEKETTKTDNGYFYAKLSVPTKNLSAFLNTLEGVGTMNSCSVSSEDVTAQYVSVEQQKAVYLKQKEMLEAELAVAESFSEKQAIIKTLSETAVTLDGFDTELKNLRNRAEYSTVYLRIYEKNTYTPPSYWEELGEVLFGSVSALGTIMGGLLTVIVAVLPFALLGAAGYWLVVLIIFIVCKARKRPFDMFAKAKERREIRYREKLLRRKQKELYLEELRKRTDSLSEQDKN